VNGSQTGWRSGKPDYCSKACPDASGQRPEPDTWTGDHRSPKLIYNMFFKMSTKKSKTINLNFGCI